MNETASASVSTRSTSVSLPPRPNLDPEPWSRPSLPLSAGGVFGAALLLVAFSAARLARFRRRRACRERSGATSEPSPAFAGDGGADAWSDRVRGLLAARFGPAWKAKTSEELIAAPELAELLDAEGLERLSRLLIAADRVKFAASADPASIEERRAGLEELERALSSPRISTTERSRSNNK